MVVNEELETRIHEILEKYDGIQDAEFIFSETKIQIADDFKKLLKSIPSREDKVKEFHQTFNQVINDKPTKIDKNTINLRLNLIQEELLELADSLGMKYGGAVRDVTNSDGDSYSDLTKVTIHYLEKNESNINLKEAFDALLDLQYVLSGTIVSLGMADIFEEGFDEVHRSNMSKACDAKESALWEAGQAQFKRNEEMKVEQSSNGKWIIQRCNDNKTIKPSTYSPANLQPILDRAV